MPGTVAGIKARKWWTALLLTVLDLQVSAPALLMLPLAAFDAAKSVLTCGLIRYRLRPQAAAAIAAVSRDASTRERLFPWDLDKGRPPFCQLYYRFRELLHRAGLPIRERELFGRLLVTAARRPNFIERVDLRSDFAPREFPVRQPRRRNPASAARPPSRLAAPPPEHSRAKRPKSRACAPALHLIAPCPSLAHRTISRFFENVYLPRRLLSASDAHIAKCRWTIGLLDSYCGCGVLLDQLNDDLAERFLCWLGRRYAPETRKVARACLLAIWRYAWRKKHVETLPRDIDAIRVPTIDPEAWSIEEISRLLSVAEQVEGTVCGIPARIYWPALLLTLFDTGLRIGALMKVRSADVDFDGAWIKARFGTQKQKADQTLGLSRGALALLKGSGAESRELVFPWPFKAKETLISRLRVLLRRAGLPSGRHDLFHKFRRTNGTFVADALGEEAAMRQLGHSAISVTRRYIDRRKLRRPRAVDVMQRPMSGASDDGSPAATEGRLQ